MLSNDFSTKLLGLQGIFITSFQETENAFYVEAKTLSKEAECPFCKHKTSKVHDYRMQKIKDLFFRNKVLYLFLRKRRYACKHCGKHFFEKYSFLPRYHRMTQRVYENILRSLRENYSMKSVAKQYEVSSTTVARVFDIVQYRLYKVPEVLSIDEFKGNAGNEKYQVILTNPQKRKVLDILPTREKVDILEYFKGFEQRNHVKYVVMDMWSSYFDVSKRMFPNAKIVIDKYHYIRQVYWALDKVRKRVQKNFIKEKRKYFKHSRKLLYAEYGRLSDENKQAVGVMILQHDDLFVAWQLKEMFGEFRKCKSCKDGKKILMEWILMAQEANLPEFKDCTTALLNWFVPIINSLECPYTNGFTEGTNNKIKVIKRNAFGYRNFGRFRNRILHCCS